MHIPNMKLLRSQLARLDPKQFDLSVSIDHSGECGTVACVAGWACLLNDGPDPKRGDFDKWKKVRNWAEGWLQLNYLQSRLLFLGHSRPMEDVTLQETLDLMDRMIAEAEACQH